MKKREWDLSTNYILTGPGCRRKARRALKIWPQVEVIDRKGNVHYTVNRTGAWAYYPAPRKHHFRFPVKVK